MTFGKFGKVRSVVGLLLLASGVALGGCNSDSIVRLDPVQGTWLHVDSAGSEFYLRITGTEQVEAFNLNPIADCFERIVYDVLDVDGDELRLGSPDDTVRVNMRRDGADLIVTVGEVEVRYASSDANLETLPVCPPPSVVALCSEQTPLVQDVELAAQLTTGDPENADGTRYDLYHVDVATAATLRIDMTSGELDSHLILFDSIGGYVVRNDNRSNRTLDARIERVFAPGCWMVMATSEDAGDFGGYTLTLTVP